MIEIFNLTRSHQTSRTSQISQISIFHLKEKFEKSSTKQMDVEDKIFMMGYLLMRKRGNCQQQKQWPEKYFCLITRCHSLSLVVPLFAICWHSLSLDERSLYERSFLYCFIKLQSLPNFVCSFIFDGLTSKVADVSAVFLWSQ